MDVNRNNVVILGAGPAGLSAGHELVTKGLKPVVAEQAKGVGGIARTETYKDYRFDIGGHRFFSKLERINRLWHEMLGDDFLAVRRLSRIYYGGRLFNYPLQVSNALSNLGLIEGSLIIASFLRAQVWRHPTEETFRHWVSNRFGARLYETFFKTYTEKVWGISCDDIAADWAAQRIKGLSLVAAVSHALLGNRNAKTLITEFNYPRLGPGMMWERFQQIIQQKGGDVRLDCKAVKIRRTDTAISGVICQEHGETVELPVDHLVSTIPITTLIALLDPKPPAPVRDAAQGLFYRAFVIVVLIVNRRDLFPDQWIYVHSPEVRVGRIQNFKNWSPAMVPDPEKSSIGMEYFCSAGDDTWTMSDADFTKMAARELSQLGLAAKEDITDSYVVRQPKAYPIYDRQYAGNLSIIRDFLAQIDNLQTIGRNGMHRYNNMDHSMLTGIFAAENILGAHHDLWQVNEDEDYLEEEKAAGVGELVREQLLTQTFARMDKFAFASSVGFVAGLLFFLATMWLIVKGGPVVGPNLALLSQFFVGYTVTVKGAFVAFGYSFFWAFLFGWLFAYLRNFLLGLFVFWAKKKAELLSLKDFFDHL